MAEILYDSIHLLHEHERLQFKSTGGKDGGAADDDDFDADGGENEKQNKTKQKMGAARITIIQKHIFPILYDLREITKTHKSSVQPHLLRLMDHWLEKDPELVKCDLKYANLHAELQDELKLWEDDEIETVASVNNDQPPASTDQLSASIANLNVSLHTPGLLWKK